MLCLSVDVVGGFIERSAFIAKLPCVQRSRERFLCFFFFVFNASLDNFNYTALAEILSFIFSLFSEVECGYV